jgi:DNA-binding NarL/FixJ family response regulator
VLELLARGMSNGEIARTLVIATQDRAQSH